MYDIFYSLSVCMISQILLVLYLKHQKKVEDKKISVRKITKLNEASWYLRILKYDEILGFVLN